MTRFPNNIQFSIIIPWKGGDPQRELALKNMLNCLKIQEPPASEEPIIFEVILVEQTIEEDSENKIKKILPQELSHEFTYIPLRYDSGFNKSWCMNVGTRTARYNHLIFMDADSLFGADYFRTIRTQIRETPHPRNLAMICWNYIICLPGKDNPISRHIRPDMTRAMGGIWYINKDFYINKFGGMNENFKSYGGEDNDAYERICWKLQLNEIAYMAYPIVHSYHDWAKPNPFAINYFELGRKYPLQITQKLKEAQLGKLEHPTSIDITDLQEKI